MAARTWLVAPEIKGRDNSGSALEAKLMDMGPREEGGESQKTPGVWLYPVEPVKYQHEAVQVQADLQHEILLPAGLAPPHSDGRALDILHLQSHVCVEFLCGGESRGQHRDSGTPHATSQALDYLL